MFDHLTPEQQLDQYKTLWVLPWLSIAGGIFLAVVITEFKFHNSPIKELLFFIFFFVLGVLPACLIGLFAKKAKCPRCNEQYFLGKFANGYKRQKCCMSCGATATIPFLSSSTDYKDKSLIFILLSICTSVFVLLSFSFSIVVGDAGNTFQALLYLALFINGIVSIIDFLCFMGQIDNTGDKLYGILMSGIFTCLITIAGFIYLIAV